MKTRPAAAAALVFFMVTAFRSGWKHEETDFPNYYTAAVLVRKGLPFRNYYDWTWFQRQMNYAGVEHTLGGYIPQTPVTMLPFIPLAGFAAQTAKRIWLVGNLFFLACVIWLLAQVTKFRLAQVWLLAFAGFGSLYSNFLLGQYYVFLLFLFTLAFYCLDRGRQAAGGFLCGTAFGLKLYGGPFLLYFAAKRQWRAVAGMFAATALLLAAAVILFGWPDVHYFATQILPRAADAEVISPYHPGNNAFPVLLRRLLMFEPELNPRPLWNSPQLFFFLRPLFALAVIAFTLLALATARAPNPRRDFSWFLVAMLLISPNISSYTTILLLLPLVLLFEDASGKERIFLLAAYIVLTLPTFTPWMWLFPKVWALLALFLFTGRNYWRSVSPKLATCVAIGVVLLAAADARHHFSAYSQEPARHFDQIVAAASPVFTPVVIRNGILYQTIGNGSYVLRQIHNDQAEDFYFAGEAFQPTATSPDGPIYFELVANRISTIMTFDPSTGNAEPTPRSITSNLASDHESEDSAVSPDGKWLAYTPLQAGPNQVWLRNLSTGQTKQLTGGNCNNQSPAWELDSKSLLFTSDCGRGMGLPALYRAPVN